MIILTLNGLCWYIYVTALTVMIAEQYVHRMYIKRPLYVYNISDILHLMFPIVCMFHQTGRCLTVASKSLASSVCLETFSNHFLPSLVMAHSPSMWLTCIEEHTKIAKLFSSGKYRVYWNYQLRCFQISYQRSHFLSVSFFKKKRKTFGNFFHLFCFMGQVLTIELGWC